MTSRDAQPDTTEQFFRRFLELVYRVFMAAALLSLGLGVPFLFIRKQGAAVVCVLMALGVGWAWRLLRQGRTQASLIFLAGFMWLVVAGMLALGQSATMTNLLLTMAVFLAMVVSQRAGLWYGVSYLLFWLGYVVLDRYGLTPPKYFVGNPLVNWFIGSLAFVGVLLPIPGLVNQMRSAMREQKAEAERRAQAEAEMVAARDAALAASQAKSSFLANMSHELRTPLNGIMGMTELALMDATDAQQKEYLQTALDSSRTLLALINEVLDVARIESGRIDLQPVTVLLRDELASVTRPLAHLAQQKGLQFELLCAPELPQELVCDAQRLRQILTNLLGNAIKFTSQGRVTLEVGMGAPGRVQMAVRDTGLGIPADRLHAIFQPFEQVDSSVTRRFGGTGLGLAISLRLAQAMGGDLTVTSTVGQGSCFLLTLPLLPKE